MKYTEPKYKLILNRLLWGFQFCRLWYEHLHNQLASVVGIIRGLSIANLLAGLICSNFIKYVFVLKCLSGFVKSRRGGGLKVEILIAVFLKGLNSWYI